MILFQYTIPNCPDLYGDISDVVIVIRLYCPDLHKDISDVIIAIRPKCSDLHGEISDVVLVNHTPLP